MFTRIAFAAALLATSSTLSLATEIDPNLAVGTSAYTDPLAVGPTTQGTFRTSAASLSAGQGYTGQPGEVEHDRASSPYAGGVG